MNNPQTTANCEHALDMAMNGDSQGQQHIESCPDCQAMLATIDKIKTTAAPANHSKDFPELKFKLMQRLAPIVKQKFREEKTESFIQSWFFKLSLAGAALILAIALTIPSLQAPSQKVLSKPPLPIVLTQNFKISVNNGPVKEVSLDNPIALFAGEKAEITVPDGSVLKAEGPARLNVTPRGFHLASGFLSASVAKESKEFVATTPHGKITVLGTIFSCNSTAQKTVVKVIEGKVKVKPDHGAEKILSVGETTEMLADTADVSETIPSIDSE